MFLSTGEEGGAAQHVSTKRFTTLPRVNESGGPYPRGGRTPGHRQPQVQGAMPSRASGQEGHRGP